MPASNGGNALRWNCERQGCFNEVKRPKIEQLAQYLQAGGADGCQFGDIDAMTERNGRFLLIEWKPARDQWDERGGGQKYAIQRLVLLSDAFTVFVVVGDPATMVVTEACAYTHDVLIPRWVPVDLPKLGRWITEWARRANALRTDAA